MLLQWGVVILLLLGAVARFVLWRAELITSRRKEYLLDLHKKMLNVVHNEIRYEKAKVNAPVRGREVARRAFAMPPLASKMHDFVLESLVEGQQFNVRTGVVWLCGWSAVVIIEQV